MAIFLICAQAAVADVLYGVQITKVYALSREGSSAHLIQINQALDGCHQNRLYIDFADKELFASALANHLVGRNVDVTFVTDGAPKAAALHIEGITCRLMSVF